MRKLLGTAYLVILGVIVLSLSGCGGGGSSSSFIGNSDTFTNAEVAVIESPVFEQGHSYKLIKGAKLSNMGGAKYFVAGTGTEAGKSTLNLGFSEELGNQTLVFVDDSTNKVVFAYDPSGTSGNKTSGTVNYSGGTQLKYRGLTIGASMFSAMNVDTASAKVIQLNGNTATIDGVSIASYDYVWHADPNHRDEYYTLGLDGTTEYDKDAVLAATIMIDGVYIAHDVRYMTSSLDFTGTVKDDEDTEYAAYYSDSVRQVVSDELGGSLTGPYIFATLPMSGGMGRNPGGDAPGGNTPPDIPSGDVPGGNTPPNMPSGDVPGGNPPGGMPPANNGASYNSQIASTMALMTHSPEEAYNNPVLHITKAGVYQLQGTWNGQIWIEVGEESSDKVAIILNSADVTCSVAPALVFKEVYECGPDDEDAVRARMTADSGDIGYSVLDDAGAVVLIADGTVNNFTGANVYRMLKPQAKKNSVTTIDGTDVSQQKKRYKMDGAFYSFMSMAMGGGEKADGVLNVKSTTYEGINTEMHMTLESGVVTVYATDDAMNFNEDNVSVFTMTGGNLTITSTGGDGIDSNGWIAILGGSLDITCAQDSNQLNAQADGPLDADCGVYMANEGVTYTHRAYSGGSSNTPSSPASGDNQPSMPSRDITPPVSGDNQPSIPSGDITPPVSGDNKPSVPSSDITPPVSGDNQPSVPSGDITPPASSDITPPASPDVTPTPSVRPTPTPSTPSNNTPIPVPSRDVTPAPSTPTTDTEENIPTPTVISRDTSTGTDTNTNTGNDTNTDTPNQQETPSITPAPVTPDTPSTTGWDTDTISGRTGTTTFSLGMSGQGSIVPDTDTSARGIRASDNVFRITRKVNTFSGITADN